jgi:hypothetical protein
MRPTCQQSCGTPGCTVETAKTCPVAVNTEGCKWMRNGGTNGSGYNGGPGGYSGSNGGTSAGGVVPAAPCVDEHPFCNFWADSEQCTQKADYMSLKCRAACGLC